MIRMTHPKHGVTHAVGAEVEWNKANGWIVDGAEPKVPEVTQDVGLSEDPKTRYTVKFGKPPHHRMKLETILDALKE